MADEQNEQGEAYEQRVLRLVEQAVRDELRVYSRVRKLGLSDDTLNSLAWALVTRLDYAFDFTWSPDWTRGGPHVWPEDAGFRARCGTCLEDSAAMPAEEDARRWHVEHAAQHAAAGQNPHS